MISYRPIRRMSALFLLTLAVSILGNCVFAQENKLLLQRFVPAYGGSCQPGYPNVIAGSMYEISLINPVDQPLQRLVLGWPQGYLLEAALDLSPGQPFVPATGLIERLNPTPFFSFDNLHNERKLLRGDSANVGKEGLNKKHFAIHIPYDLAGHTLTIRALYHSGALSLQNKTRPGDKPISITAPCDQNDTARIVASWIFIAWASNDSDRVIALADSMLACDLSDAIAWDYAHTTALRLAQFDKALAYLDRMFQDFGVINIDEYVSTGRVPPLNRNGPRDPQQQQLYERSRNQLIEVIAREAREQR